MIKFIKKSSIERPFKCNRCSRAFTTKQNMQVHQGSRSCYRIDDNKEDPSKPFKCPLCKTGFKQKMQWIRHQSVIREAMKVEPGYCTNLKYFPGNFLLSLSSRIVLKSPASGESIFYEWPSIGLFDGLGSKILKLIQYVCKEFPEINAKLNHISLNKINTMSYQNVLTVCDAYNEAVGILCSQEKSQRLNQFPSRELLHYIIDLVYNEAIKDPSELNKYKPFSPEVYGETTFEMMTRIIDKLSISPEDKFIDLGSGIGHLVLQMAGSVEMKSCIGIEIADLPSKYAIEMDLIFRRWMRWFGKKFNHFELIKGDFLNEVHREKINSATIVFVNNLLFGSNIDHQLEERFADLRDGTKVISSKNYCSLNFRAINERNFRDIDAIMRLKETLSYGNSVSWTNSPVSYYFQQINRSDLQTYMQQRSNLNMTRAGQRKSNKSRTTAGRANQAIILKINSQSI